MGRDSVWRGCANPCAARCIQTRTLHGVWDERGRARAVCAMPRAARARARRESSSRTVDQQVSSASWPVGAVAGTRRVGVAWQVPKWQQLLPMHLTATDTCEMGRFETCGVWGARTRAHKAVQYARAPPSFLRNFRYIL